MSEAPDYITEHAVFDAGTCRAVLDALPKAAGAYVDRYPATPGKFVTYGRAAYLDICMPDADAQEQYYSKVAASNRVLMDAMGEMYAQLKSVVGGILGAPVTYRPDVLGVPGLHVIRGDAINITQGFGVHFDTQYERLRLPVPMDEDTYPISFTLPLLMPKNGTGLQVYDLNSKDLGRLSDPGETRSLSELAQLCGSRYLPYSVGTLVFHHGLLGHHAASSAVAGEDDERITVQGHGVLCGGEWILYW
ncbi:hypothetical protein [Luteibacter sahnii]|uniref:hypothetical protein n=1 Tax=Luteibacter sahnii TaxID=3021977 RepID=UPI002A69FE3B|nr:hypothetical protein [Luteibacter sp. PPL193]MDY1548717.1 hypothetical protein [Luteibacter sp. PPL193]